MPATKICSACGVEKPATVEHFYRAGKLLRGRCKPCEVARIKAWALANPDKDKAAHKAWALANRDNRLAYNKAWTLANADKKRAAIKAWRLANADKVRAANKERKQAWRLANPDKAKATQKAWREANADKYRAAVKAWHLANPEKIKAKKARRRAHTINASGSHTPADIRNLFAEQSGLCAYCKIALPKNYHVDHVVPLSRGGSNAPSNLCLSCPRCNLSKGAKLIVEFSSDP